MAGVAAGVYATFEKLGIKEPQTALEMLAVTLAEAMDSGPEDKSIAGISRELRLILDQIRLDHPSDYQDDVEKLANRN